MPDDQHLATADVSAVDSWAALRQYYEGRIPLSRLLGQATPEPPDTRDPVRIEELLADLHDFDPDLGKTVKLVFKRSNRPLWLQSWLIAVIKHDMGSVLDPKDCSRGPGLRRLVTRCRTALVPKKVAQRRRTYNLFRLALLHVHSDSRLDPCDLVAEATRWAIDERQLTRGDDLERKAITPLLQATSSAAFKKILLSLRFWTERDRAARAASFAAEEKVERLSATVDGLRRDLATAREKNRALEDHAARSDERVDSLTRKLEVEHNKRINKMREAKGRVLHLFDSGLSPRLRGARDALDGRSVATDVAIERIDRVLELLEEERPWLSSD